MKKILLLITLAGIASCTQNSVVSNRDIQSTVSREEYYSNFDGGRPPSGILKPLKFEGCIKRINAFIPKLVGNGHDVNSGDMVDGVYEYSCDNLSNNLSISGDLTYLQNIILGVKKDNNGENIPFIEIKELGKDNGLIYRYPSEKKFAECATIKYGYYFEFQDNGLLKVRGDYAYTKTGSGTFSFIIKNFKNNKVGHFICASPELIKKY